MEPFQPWYRTNAGLTSQFNYKLDWSEPAIEACWVWFRHIDNRGSIQQLFESSRRPFEPTGEHQDGGKKERCLCKRHRDSLTLTMESGAVHYIALPFSVSHMNPLNTGLLLQRATEGEAASTTRGLPVLFTLCHPMSDLCPVATKPSTSTQGGYVTDPHLEIVSSCPQNRDLLLLYHKTSHTHTICEVKPAATEDIPAHMNTPHGRKGSLSSTPRSTSAPALQTTPGQRLDTPAQMVLTGNRKLRACGQYKIPLSGGRGAGPGAVKIGRSPFLAKFQSPMVSQKRSKSLSPSHHAGRLSPFSQTISSSTWSTFFSEESAVSLEPLLPQICLHKVLDIPERAAGAASTFFGCGCLLSSSKLYLYYILPRDKVLCILGYHDCDSVTPHCAAEKLICAIPATHAIPIPSLNVIVVLSPAGEVSVFSGTQKVCGLDLDWLLRNHYGSCASGDGGDGSVEMGERRVVGLREGTGNQFFLELSTGEVPLSCTLPPLYVNLAVELSVRSLAAVLPAPAAHSILADYYRVCIEIYPTPFSMQHFQNWLLSSLALPLWVVSDHQFQDLMGVPAMKLFGKRKGWKHTVSQQHHPGAEVSAPIKLVQYRQQIFKSLHLVYEELKLYASEVGSLPHLASLLHHVATCLGFSGYCDYYHADHPSLIPSSLTSEGGDEEEMMECEDDEVEGGGEDTHPPNLMSHLHLMLTGAAGHVPFPLLSDVCKKTAQLVQVF
jgi:hypothetical protein